MTTGTAYPETGAAPDIVVARYHQLDSVRRLVAHARDHGAGENYLVQNSAGSGKSNSISWLAHRLVSLHDKDDKRVFDSVIVVTDRVALPLDSDPVATVCTNAPRETRSGSGYTFGPIGDDPHAGRDGIVVETIRAMHALRHESTKELTVPPAPPRQRRACRGRPASSSPSCLTTSVVGRTSPFSVKGAGDLAQTIGRGKHGLNRWCPVRIRSEVARPMIALLSVVAMSLLNLRQASRRPDAKVRPATDLVDPRYVAVLRAWRYKKNASDPFRLIPAVQRARGSARGSPWQMPPRM